jgi:3-deoxy-manno-octulosonate cytidylyltransferase (CMP-KDO synthetase)
LFWAPGEGLRIRTIAVIPARFGSTRFPGKLLADLGGRSVLARVIDRVHEAGLSDIVVATDDDRLETVAREAGARVVRPAGDFRSGADRVAAALPLIASPEDGPDDIVLNVQGDEPFIEPALLSGVAGLLESNRSVQMATAASPATLDDRENPNVVKVVLDDLGCALYFSRAPIPAQGPSFQGSKEPVTLRHIGLYAYRRDLLLRFSGWPPGRLEQVETLEQLRALERGVSIQVLVRPSKSIGIDTPADLEAARRFL